MQENIYSGCMRKAAISIGYSIAIVVTGLILTAGIVLCDSQQIRESSRKNEYAGENDAIFAERVRFLTSHVSEFSDNTLILSAVSSLARVYGSCAENNRIADGGMIRYESGTAAAECSYDVRRNPFTARDCRVILLYDGSNIVSEIDVNYSGDGGGGSPIPEVSYTFFVNDDTFGYMITFFPEGKVKYAVAKFRNEPGWAESVPIARYNVMRNN